MRERDDVILELYSENVIVAVFGIGETPTAPLDRLVEGLRHAVEQIGPADVEERRAFAEPPPWGPLELAPRDAFLGPQEVVPFDAAEGRIAAESLAAYPPGVPNVLPGERLTGPTIAYIADSLAHGGLVRGASDRTLQNDPGGDRMSGRAGRWGVDSEYGRLLDVLLCPPDSFRWRETSAITRATLEAGPSLRPGGGGRASTPSLVAAYEDAGVRCHFLEPEPALPYQVFTRDSSTMGPHGTVVTQPAQWWRRGEYAPVIRFHQRAGIPIRDMITAGSLEGGDVMIVEPGAVLIGTGESRTQEVAATPAGGLVSRGRLGGPRPAVPGALRPHRRAGRRARREAGGGLLRGAAERCRRVAARQGLRPDPGERRAGLHARASTRSRWAATG